MYNKLFSKILDSSIWLESAETRIVWFTLMAAMDEDGYAHFAALENLAARARVTVEQAKAAITTFESPDPNSSNPANEGRRVQKVPGGYMILNAIHHRNLMNRIQERESVRERVAKHRAKKSKATENEGVAGDVTVCNGKGVTVPLQNVTPASVYASETASGNGGVGERGVVSIVNTLAIGICAIYGKSPQALSCLQQQALSEIAKRPGAEDELVLLRKFKRRAEFFPESFNSLLEKWDSTVDRARAKPKQSHGNF